MRKKLVLFLECLEVVYSCLFHAHDSPHFPMALNVCNRYIFFLEFASYFLIRLAYA